MTYALNICRILKALNFLFRLDIFSFSSLLSCLCVSSWRYFIYHARTSFISNLLFYDRGDKNNKELHCYNRLSEILDLSTIMQRNLLTNIFQLTITFLLLFTAIHAEDNQTGVNGLSTRRENFSIQFLLVLVSDNSIHHYRFERKSDDWLGI